MSTQTRQSSSNCPRARALKRRDFPAARQKQYRAPHPSDHYVSREVMGRERRRWRYMG